MKTAQVAMEFMLIIIIVIVFTTFLATTAYFYMEDSYDKRNLNDLEDLGRSLQNEIILAHTVESGYHRSVYVPQKIRSFEVNISGASEEIVINYKGSDLVFRIPPTQGSFSTGYNQITRQGDGSVAIS